MQLQRDTPEPDDGYGDLVDYGRQVISTEAAALASLADLLDDSFAAAVLLLLSARGRVIVTGMGKSGHVGRKVAATFASTGTPAMFVHPAEAAHGDLGMLVPGDVLLALSNSGATAELQAILAHARRYMLPIIGVAAREHSPLMLQADVRVLLPQVEEACPANLAPTSSTAMMMALGDAMAMAAMRARGVTRDSFEVLHPGGNIGKRLSRVTAIMHAGDRMPLVGADMKMREVIVTMTTKSLGIAGVVDGDGRLIGVITDGDLRRHADQDLMSLQASEVMTHGPVTVPATSFAEDALTLMNEHKVTALFVMDELAENRPVGAVHVHDFLRLGVV